MPNIFKDNKTFITTGNRKKILKEYFEGGNPTALAKKYGYTIYVVRNYLKGRATKTFIDDKGTVWRKCSTCEPIVYKTLDNYKKHSLYNGKIVLHACCNSCLNRILVNRKKIEKNKDGSEAKYLQWQRKSWAKNKWRYNVSRKIMRLIGYADRNGRVIQKKETNS